MALRRISDSVYVRIQPIRIPSRESNRGYIICDKFVVIVDTSYFLDSLRSDLEELRRITGHKVGFVINTHYHSDHAYGNTLFGCPIIAHAECPRLMKKVRKQEIQEILEGETEPIFREQMRKLRLRYPSILFKKSYRIKSNPAIEVIHVGGHTPDLSIVHVPDEGILFASDNMFGSKHPSGHSHPYIARRSNLIDWILALERIHNMNTKAIVPGHFGICNNEAVKKMSEYLKLFMRNLRESKDQGYSKEELIRHPEVLELPSLEVERWVKNNIETQYDNLSKS